MNGRRALEILASFTTGQLSFTAIEIEELIKLQLVVEVDPIAFSTWQFLEPVVAEYAETAIDDPTVATLLATKLGEIDEKLKSSWSRLTSSDEKVRRQEQTRRTLRRALAVVNDVVMLRSLIETRNVARQLPQNVQFWKCAELGDELYALTPKGARVQRQLALRIDRYADYPLTAFLKPFEKTEGKMAAFAGDIAQLSANVGYVKKNPHQVVIGLAKSGAPPRQALDTYRGAMRGKAGNDPSVAVTFTRNAAAAGGLQEVADKLRAARDALWAAGFPNTPEVSGAAKTLLTFEPISSGVTRFAELTNLVVGSNITSQRLDVAIKCVARLMPAEGTPTEIMRRVQVAVAGLRKMPSQIQSHADEVMTAVALASMVRDEAAVTPLIQRYRQIEAELVRGRVSLPNLAAGHALECVGCPGSPAEVVDTVRALAHQVASQQNRGGPNSADVAVAVSFAKRFAY